NAVAGGGYSQVYACCSTSNSLVLQPALDPFARAGLSQAQLANLFGTERIKATSQLASWDGKLVGRVFELPAGDVDFAVGASWRREALSGHADANGRVTDPVTHLTGGNAQLWVLGFNFDPFAAHRNISALFAETRIPITPPSWSVPGVACDGEDGHNPNLKPATSVSRSIGVVFKPHFVPGLSATVDFSSINLYGFAGGLGFNNILASVNQLGSASRYFNNIAVDNFP